MSSRLRRTARSFAFVFVAFWVYRLLAAPWIDPSFVLEEQARTSDIDIDRARYADKERLKKYERIFPPGSWELDQPIMLESDGVELLMKDYENLGEGRIRLSQCTMLRLASDDPGESAPGRVIILRAPEGAVLQFDADLNLRRGKVGKLIGGQLNGPVTIHGAPSQPGADDELFIATRDVRMDERKAWSKNLVEFRYGPSYGQGRDLTIHLLPAGGAAQKRGSNIGGFERLELARDVEMHLQPGSTGLFPGDERKVESVAPSAGSTSGRASDEKPPVDIRCRGPFGFDLVSRVASFRDTVVVFRLLPQGASDQMTCDELLVFFGNKARFGPQAAGDNKSQTAAGPDKRLVLQAERMKATGNPVTVDAPSNNVFIRAGQLDYEIAKRRVGIEAAPAQSEATLTWMDNKFNGKFGGRSLVVERPSGTGLPTVVAAGEGWLDAAEPNDPTRVLHARWSREMTMRPDGPGHLVSLIGDAHANFPQFGELQAGQIHLWLVQLNKSNSRETSLRQPSNPGVSPTTSSTAAATAAPQYPATPERMLAVGNVSFTSPQLSGDTERLEVWFDPAGTLLPTPQKPGSSGARSIPGGLTARDSSPSVQSPAGQITAQGDSRATSIGRDTSANGPQTTPPTQHFELHGERIQVELLSQGELRTLNNATITGAVRFLETRTEKPTDAPIEITGDWLNVQDAATAQRTTVVVRGKPAFISARGMQMTGGQIDLDRGRNTVRIDGAGRTVLPPGRTAHVEPTARQSPAQSQFTSLNMLAGAPVSIDFAGGMTFDGTVARYRQQVLVRSDSQTLRAGQPNAPETRRRTVETDAVEVRLRRPVDLGLQKAAQEAEVEQIACLGPVTMTERTSDYRGDVARQTLVARDLSISQTTGDIHAVGPGRLEITRLGSANAIPGRTTLQEAPQKADGLVYTRVDFQREITGNLRPQQLTLHEDVRGVYGPVERWGDRLELSPEKIAPKVVTFRSDALNVRQVPGNAPNTTAVELEALGNTDVDGDVFSARAHSLTYVNDKQQLTFRGDGRSIADLYYQPHTGGAWTRARAGKIEYWPATGQVNVNEAQFFDLGQLGGTAHAVPRTR